MNTLKKLLSITLIALTCFVISQFPHQLIVSADDEDFSMTQFCGDANGDGKINISDASYILNWLFLGGEDPECAPEMLTFTDNLEAEVQALTTQNEELTAQVAELEALLAECQEPSGSCGSLTKTQQGLCYDANGNTVNCRNENFPGQDGGVRAGCSNVDRFVDNGDGTVTDTFTGLMWQEVTADTNDDGWSNNNDRVDWQQALEYCADLVFAEHEDWRLPNVKELQSIADYSRPFPSVFPEFSAISDGYHTSTSWAQDPSSTWGVGVGMVQVHSKSKLFFVRAVRGGL